MPQWRMARWVTALGTAAALTALAACTDEPGEAAEGSPEEVKVNLVDLLNENERLFAELWETEPKVIRVCLEDAGFTVHNEAVLHRDYALGVDVGGLQEDFYDFQYWLPTTEMAPEWGFGQWLWHTEGENFEALDEYNRLLNPEQVEPEEPEDPDNSAFEALDVEEKVAWYIAYQGEERTVHDDLEWRLSHPNATESEMDERRRELEGESDTGEIDLTDEHTEPKPGGCELEMIESLYGEPQLVTEEMDPDADVGVTVSTWEYRPEAPRAPQIDRADLDAATAEASGEFLSCVAEAGYGEWTMQNGSWLPVSGYFDLVYTGELLYFEDAEEERAAIPDPPDDLPDDFAGKKAYEIEMAVAFADCAERSQYREAFIEAHDAAELAAYQSIETELFAYQEQLRDALTTAQEIIEG